jgi:Mg2+/citrate symporter
VELVLILGFLLFVYLLGEHAGRESPSRSKQVQEIVKAEADLKNLKTNLHSTTTSPWLHWFAILLALIVVYWLLGGFRDDGYYREYRRFR